MGAASLSIVSSLAVDGGLGGAAVSMLVSAINIAAVAIVADAHRAFLVMWLGCMVWYVLSVVQGDLRLRIWSLERFKIKQG